MTTVVRTSTAADAPLLRLLRLEALLDAPLSYGATYEETLAWTDDQWIALASASTTFVADVTGHIVGTARGGMHDEEPVDSPHRWLWGMYVTPQSRGTRVAADLVERVMAWAVADGGASLHLYVSSQAPRARALYAKMGFRDDPDKPIHQHTPTLSFQPLWRSL